DHDDVYDAPVDKFKMGGESSAKTLSPKKDRVKLSDHLPERYTIKGEGDERVLICLEAPNLNVHIEAGLSVTGSVARKSPGGTIFLDGVAQCEPFMDHERQVYNFDHHEGCVRAFTLATCEQTLVMYMKGLDLQGREWNIFANDPDLDAILSIWILMNHARIGTQDSTQRRILFSLVRYEGVIDALGLELKDLSALPQELVRKLQRVIDHLRSDEVGLKKEGRWGHTDFLIYTASILHKIDQIFYKPGDFADFKGIGELARIDLSDQRIAAVVEADMGIYEIEPHLNKIYGNRLGVVFLKTGSNTFTVRQMDLFMPITLDEIYDRLNFADPAVKCRTQNNKWGGAADIGGSPREAGTKLSPAEICLACRDSINRSGFGQQAYRFGMTALLVALILMIAQIIKVYWNPGQWLDREDLSMIWMVPDTGFILATWGASVISLLFIAYCRPWQYGWIRSVGGKWWFFLPLVILAGATGGVWSPQWLAQEQDWLQLVALGWVGMPLVSELLFRSLAHGLLTQGARIQRNDTRMFISWPNVGSTLMYIGFICFISFFAGSLESDFFDWQSAMSIFSAAVLGLALGMVRERSQSIFPPIFFHMVAASVALMVFRFF
ncbi:MAG: CPBP family glutamic-type intramembrane protease, partial [Desulfobacteraceae bacterium]